MTSKAGVRPVVQGREDVKTGLRDACPGGHAGSFPASPPAVLPEGTVRAEYLCPCGARWTTWWRDGRPVEQREETGPGQ